MCGFGSAWGQGPTDVAEALELSASVKATIVVVVVVVVVAAAADDATAKYCCHLTDL